MKSGRKNTQYYCCIKKHIKYKITFCCYLFMNSFVISFLSCCAVFQPPTDLGVRGLHWLRETAQCSHLSSLKCGLYLVWIPSYCLPLYLCLSVLLVNSGAIAGEWTCWGKIEMTFQSHGDHAVIIPVSTCHISKKGRAPVTLTREAKFKLKRYQYGKGPSCLTLNCTRCYIKVINVRSV